MSKFQLDSKVLRLAASQNLYSRLVQATFEQHLVSKSEPSDLVGYLEFFSYNETPMKTAVVDAASVFPTSTQADSGLEAVTARSQHITKLKTDAASAKVLQCKQRFGMVFKHSGKYIRMFGDIPSPLSVMQQGTAQVLTESLERLCSSTAASQHFPLKTCLFSSDRASYNLLAEDALVQHKPGSGWQALATHCEVHITARTFTKTFQTLLGPQLTGIIRCALSLRDASAMSTFRLCLREEIYLEQAEDLPRSNHVDCRLSTAGKALVGWVLTQRRLETQRRSPSLPSFGDGGSSCSARLACCACEWSALLSHRQEAQPLCQASMDRMRCGSGGACQDRGNSRKKDKDHSEEPLAAATSNLHSHPPLEAPPAYGRSSPFGIRCALRRLHLHS